MNEQESREDNAFMAGYDEGRRQALREARRICLKYEASEGDGNMFITVSELADELAALATPERGTK